MLDRRYANAVLTLALALTLCASGGCEMFDDGRDEHAKVPPTIDRSVSTVPGDAKIVATSPAPLTYRPTANGVLYLFDATEKRVVHVQEIDPGETFEVLMSRSAVKVNDRSHPVTPLQRDHEYRLYFSAESRGQDR